MQHEKRDILIQCKQKYLNYKTSYETNSSGTRR
jgi:hypothetical protein